LAYPRLFEPEVAEQTEGRNGGGRPVGRAALPRRESMGLRLFFWFVRADIKKPRVNSRL